MFWMGLCVFVYFSVLFPLWMILYDSMFKLVCFHRKIFTQIMTCSIVFNIQLFISKSFKQSCYVVRVIY